MILAKVTFKFHPNAEDSEWEAAEWWLDVLSECDDLHDIRLVEVSLADCEECREIAEVIEEGKMNREMRDDDARFAAFARGFKPAAGREPVFEEDYETATLDGYETEDECYQRGVFVAARNRTAD